MWDFQYVQNSLPFKNIIGNAAAGIDAAVKNMGIKVNASGSMEKQVDTETQNDFIFYIEF